MGVIRKRGKNYVVDYRLHGRRVWKSVGPSKKLAELYLKDVEVKIARGELGFDQKDARFSDLLSEYQAYCKTNLAPGTRKRYGSIIDNFNRFLSKTYSHMEKVSQFFPKLFEDFKQFRKEEGAANRTVNAELIVIRMMFRLAVQWGYAKKNPTDGISKLRVPSKNAPMFLTEEQCQKLLNASDDFLRPIFFTFLNTGMRKGELENLEWTDIDFDRRKIMIHVKDDWSPKTDEREIPINDGLFKVLQDQKAKANGSRYVFPDEENGKIYKNRLRNRFMTMTKRCGFPEVTQVHTLRHTFASHLVMKGVDLATVKKLMGHSDIETTMIYSHLTEKHVDEAVDRLKF